MFYSLPYEQLGFTDTEWEEMPHGHRRIIKSYVLNGYDRGQTSFYDEYDTDQQVRKVEVAYGLPSRPRIQLCIADFHIPCS